MGTGHDERRYIKRNRRARVEGAAMHCTFASAYGDDDPSDSDSGRSPRKRHRSSDLPSRIHFVSAGSAVPSQEPDPSQVPTSNGKSRRFTSPPPPASLASNAVVANMMRLMNYKQGTGLGKHGQGIVAPIEVSIRPRNAGLGSTYDDPTARQNSPPPTTINWPKWNDDGKSQKQRHDRPSAEQNLVSLREANAAEAPARAQKVGDLSGRTAQFLTGTTKVKHGCKEESFANEDGSMRAMAAITGSVERVQAASASGALTMDALLSEFTGLKEQFPEEYEMYCLADTAFALAAPLLRPVFDGWEPLRDPSRGLDMMHLLKGILDDASAASPYAALVADVVLPAVNALAASAWEATDPDPMVRLLDGWEEALPPSALQCILEQVVMPKLAAAVDCWEPRWELVPAHVWVHRWLPILGPWLETLYDKICSKLGRALKQSHVGDASAYVMVSPWKEVFDPASWEEFVARYIMPKLRKALQELDAKPPPAKQKNDAFNQVMKWASVVPVDQMVQLLETEFFSKWQSGLRQWLRARNSDSREAVVWYEGWKRLFTPDLLADERVREGLAAGRDTINRAAQGPEMVRPVLKWRRHRMR